MPEMIIFERKSAFRPRLYRLGFLMAAFLLILFLLPQLESETQFLPGGLRYFSPEFWTREQTIKEIFAVIEKYSTGLNLSTKQQLAEVIYEESVRHNQDPKFILALIKIESSFQNWSVSEQGAKGLMQLMPQVAKSLAKELDIEWGGDSTLFNPLLNIRIGMHYLSQLNRDFNDIGLALTAYNYGPTYVKGLLDKKQRIPQYYYQRILKVYQDDTI
jgi:soluble lytic murein transglycosylase-like protein